MFIFFIGGVTWRYVKKPDGEVVQKTCLNCGVHGAHYEVIPSKCLILFFIPVHTFETGDSLLECPNCRIKSPIKYPSHYA